MLPQYSLSPNGERFIQDYEEKHLVVYNDGGGVPTGGWGHTGPDVPSIGTKLTEEQIERWFQKDVSWAEGIVDTLVKVSLTQNQYDALVSFAFNVGAEAFRDSTLLRRVNARRWTDVPKQFKRWIYDNGNVKNGLVCRRNDEVDIFVNSVYKRTLPCRKAA